MGSGTNDPAILYLKAKAFLIAKMLDTLIRIVQYRTYLRLHDTAVDYSRSS